MSTVSQTTAKIVPQNFSDKQTRSLIDGGIEIDGWREPLGKHTEINE